MLRQEYERLCLPQPETLDGVDVIEECIRLAGVPTPGALPAGLHELNVGDTIPAPSTSSDAGRS